MKKLTNVELATKIDNCIPIWEKEDSEKSFEQTLNALNSNDIEELTYIYDYFKIYGFDTKEDKEIVEQLELRIKELKENKRI